MNKSMTREQAENQFMEKMKITLEKFRMVIKTIINDGEYSSGQTRGVGNKIMLPRQIINENKNKYSKMMEKNKKKKGKSGGGSSGLVFVFNTSWDLVMGIMIGMNKSVRSISASGGGGGSDFVLDDSYEININTFQFQIK